MLTCGGCPVHCRRFRSISALEALNASNSLLHPHPPSLLWNKRQCLSTLPPSLGGGVCFGNPPGGVRPRRKLKANAESKEARTFFDATLPRRSGGDLGRTARWCVRARKVGAPAEGGLGRPSLARGETLGKAPPLPYFSPTPRPPSVKK